MAPFVPCSSQRPGRFSDGSFGLYYAGDSTEVAIAENLHQARFMRATDNPPGWTSQFRELIGSIDADLNDATGRSNLLDPDDYHPSQVFGAERRASTVERHHLAPRPLPRRALHRGVLARYDPDPDARQAFRISLDWGNRRLRQAAGDWQSLAGDMKPNNHDQTTQSVRKRPSCWNLMASRR
ncbi:RES domain-containing protein [Roseinatronobacter thiooxidans]|uniref:RES domain-containing protein n=1 Tax=Roseinatronobacter thiooxidans TaxID=121821 RepID=A0A2W7QIF8_9RHOB|nr:RES domain-containing protein [Roseinatronobacter thiooxidans]